MITTGLWLLFPVVLFAVFYKLARWGIPPDDEVSNRLLRTPRSEWPKTTGASDPGDQYTVGLVLSLSWLFRFVGIPLAAIGVVLVTIGFVTR